MHKWSLSNTSIFSIRHISAFLNLEVLDSSSALWLEATLKCKISSKKHKSIAFHCQWKGHLFSIQELQEGRVSPCWTSANTGTGTDRVTQTSPSSAWLWMSGDHKNVASVTNKFSKAGELEHTESACNEDQFCLFFCSVSNDHVL